MEYFMSEVFHIANFESGIYHSIILYHVFKLCIKIYHLFKGMNRAFYKSSIESSS